MLLRRSGRGVQADRRPRPRASGSDRARSRRVGGHRHVTRGAWALGHRARVRVATWDRRSHEDPVGNAHVRRALRLVPASGDMSEKPAHRGRTLLLLLLAAAIGVPLFWGLYTAFDLFGLTAALGVVVVLGVTLL